MSDLAAGLLLLSNMNTPVTSRRSSNRPSSARPRLPGRLHEIALRRPGAALKAWWPASRVAGGGGGIPSPQIPVLGRPRCGKGPVAKRLVAGAPRSWPHVVIDPHDGYDVLLDELAGCEPFDLAPHVDQAIDPLTFELSRAPRVSAGEW